MINNRRVSENIYFIGNVKNLFFLFVSKNPLRQELQLIMETSRLSYNIEANKSIKKYMQL